MGHKTTKTGIDIMGDVPWGTHLCQFYKTKKEMFDILVPYFQAGLKNNEFCMWITSAPVSKKEVKAEMSKTVPDFNRYLKTGQIEIIPHTEWYLQGGVFNMQGVLNAWIDKLDRALDEGYDGLRVTGNTAWFGKNDWNDFTEYEREINNIIGKYRLIAICTYSLDSCGAAEVIDVVSHHQFAIIRRRDEWEFIKSSNRKPAWDEPIDNEAQFCQVTENINDVFWICNGNFTKIIYLNPVFEKIWGFPCKSIIENPKALIDTIYPDDRNRLYTNFKKFNDGVFEESFRIMRPDGKIIWIRIRMFPIRNKSGEIYRFAGIASDISGIMQEFLTIWEGYETYKTLVETSPDAVTLTDLEGRITYASQSTLKLHGFDRVDELIGKSAFDFIAPEDRGRALTNLQKTLTHGFVRDLHYTLLKKDGMRFTGELNAAVIKDVDGKPKSFIATTRDVTERVRMEEQLKEMNTQLQTLIQAIPDIVYFKDAQGRNLIINKAFEQLVGLKQSEIIGKTDEQLFPEELANYCRQSDEEVLKRNRPLCFEEQLSKDGKKMFFETIKAPLYDDQGNIRGLVGVSRDISERKKAAKALQDSEMRFRSIVENSHDGILIVDNTFRFTYVNDELCRILGYSREEIIGQDFRKYLDEDSKRLVADRYIRRQRGEKIPSRYEFNIVRKSGEKRRVEISVTVIKDPAEGVKTVAQILDITERKQTEKALRESEGKYRALVENAFDGIYIISPEGFEYVNPAFEKIFGYKNKEVCSKDFNFLDLVHPDDKNLIIQREEARKKGKKLPPNYSFRVLTKDGKTRYVEVDTVPLPGDKVRVLGMLRDITERKQAEKEKAKLEEQLRQSQKMEAIGQLAGGIAHDFNNLLTAIIGNTELLLEDLPAHDTMRTDVEEIKMAADRAALLTRQLLAFSRRQPLQPRVLALNTVVANMEKILQRLIDEDIELITIFEPELRPVKADPGQMEQVIMNLAVNACDAMPEGGKLIIKTENRTLNKNSCKLIPYARRGKFACLSITDTGVGIDKAIIDQIFEPFFSTKGPEVGTGLGLSVVYGIVKQHNGWINVYSEPGQGSSFKLFLPTFSEMPEHELKETNSLQELQGSGERILLVEDEETVRKFSIRSLRENGYVVFEAATAEEALNIFTKERGNFNLVFSDVVLPDKSGLQLIDEFLSRKPELRVLLSSGYTNQKSQWTRIRKRGFRFLQKPYALSELLRTLREVI